MTKALPTKLFDPSTLRGDVYGGITAAVVALPLALAFGVASGAGPIAGLYGAIFVGFFASLFGGTPSQVSGPTGPMTVVMAAIFLAYPGQPSLAVAIILMGGLFQILFGVLRLGSLISMVPFTVISGFMSGIGVIIILLQLGPLLGHAASTEGVAGALAKFPALLVDVDFGTAAISAFVLIIVFGWPSRFNAKVPSPLLALIAGTLLAIVAVPDISVLGEIPVGLPELKLPTIDLARFPGMIGWALVLALLGSIDSLLTSLIADSVTRVHHRSNRELIGQGIGNIAAGFAGGIPGAGATMRTIINVRAGGRTRLSGMIHALVLLAVVLGLAPLASHIPHAVLAGILIKVGIDIIDWRYLRRIFRAPRSGVAIMILVLVLTVFVDLIVAFSAGMVVASLLFVKRMSELQLQNIRAAHKDSGLPLTPADQAALDQYIETIAYFHFSGPMSFGAAKNIARRVVPDETHKVLILDLSDVPMIDTTAAFAIEDIVTNAISLDVSVIIAGQSPAVGKMISRLQILEGSTVLSVEGRSEAIEKAVETVNARSGTEETAGSAISVPT